MTRLAKIGKNGRIWINPSITGKAHTRVLRHMKVFKKLRKQKVPRNRAIREALKAEHRGMTMHQIHVYEGRLSAIARARIKK